MKKVSEKWFKERGWEKFKDKIESLDGLIEDFPENI